MSTKLTKWFPGSVKPARPGVYERKNACFLYAFWTGSLWSYGSDSTENAAYLRDAGISCWQSAPWRGLAKEPK